MQLERTNLDELYTVTQAHNESDYETSITLKDEEVEHRAHLLELEIKKEELEGARQDRKQRGEFSTRIFYFVLVYIVLSLLILVVSGAGWIVLDDAVLMTLLGTTTADIIGIFAIVAKYLFHTKER